MSMKADNKHCKQYQNLIFGAAFNHWFLNEILEWNFPSILTLRFSQQRPIYIIYNDTFCLLKYLGVFFCGLNYNYAPGLRQLNGVLAKISFSSAFGHLKAKLLKRTS